MGQTLDTLAPRTLFDSPPHFRMGKDEDATVVRLFSEEHGEPVASGDSPSAAAVRGWFVQSLLVEAIVRHEAGRVTAAERVLERALELAARDRVLLPFLVDPVPELLDRQACHTAHADLMYEIFELRAELEGTAARPDSESLAEPLTESEARILRLLATELSQREIADELYVSLNTVKTHVKHLYAKLDVRTRHHAIERARAPSECSPTRQAERQLTGRSMLHGATPTDAPRQPDERDRPGGPNGSWSGMQGGVSAQRALVPRVGALGRTEPGFPEPIG